MKRDIEAKEHSRQDRHATLPEGMTDSKEHCCSQPAVVVDKNQARFALPDTCPSLDITANQLFESHALTALQLSCQR